MLDIGGGFPGAPDAAITFEEVSCQSASKTHLRNVSFRFNFVYLRKASQGVKLFQNTYENILKPLNRFYGNGNFGALLIKKPFSRGLDDF